jgi:hypothetical protein
VAGEEVGNIGLQDGVVGPRVDEEGIALEAAVQGVGGVVDGHLRVGLSARVQDKVQVAEVAARPGRELKLVNAGDVEEVAERSPAEGPTAVKHVGEAEEVLLSGADGARNLCVNEQIKGGVRERGGGGEPEGDDSWQGGNGHHGGSHSDSRWGGGRERHLASATATTALATLATLATPALTSVGMGAISTLRHTFATAFLLGGGGQEDRDRRAIILVEEKG